MSVLKFTTFGGQVPRLTKRDLADNQSQVAENLMADTPEFRPLMGHGPEVTLDSVPVPYTAKTLFRYPMKSGADLFGSPFKLALVKSPIAGDQYDRMYGALLKDDPAEYAPVVFSSDGVQNTLIPHMSYRPLGVKPPLSPLTLTKEVFDTQYVSTTAADSFRASLPAQIKQILLTIREVGWALGGKNLDAMAGFIPSHISPGSGVYQRIWTAKSPSTPEAPQWETYNGTAMASHLWAIEQGGAPVYADGPGGAWHTYYYTFQGNAQYWKLSANTTAARAAMAAIKKPGTDDAALSTDDINAILDAAATLFTDPASTKLTGVEAAYRRFEQELGALTSVLSVGHGWSEAYASAAKMRTDLKTAADTVLSLYDAAWDSLLDHALTEYTRQAITPNLPSGEVEIVESRYYTFTLVNDRKEESRPFYPADVKGDLPFIEVNQAEAVNVVVPSDVLTVAGIDASYNITHWRLYRSASGSNASEFMFVVEQPIATKTYRDELKTEQLNEALMTKDWEPPPVVGGKNLRHFVAMPGGFLAGFIGNTVYFSEPYVPYAWPAAYSVPVQSEIVALGVFGVTLVVLTESGPVYMSGNSPDSMSTVVIESQEVCQSPKSVVPVTGGVLFASQNGLCLATQGGVQVLTLSLATNREWREFVPANVICEEYNGVVYVSHSGLSAMYAVHVPTMKMTAVMTPVTALYADISTGDLFAAMPPASGQKPKYVEMFAGSEPMEARWRSKRIVLGQETGFAWMSVEGEQSSARPLSVDVFGYYVDSSGVEVEHKLQTARAANGRSAVVHDTRPFRVSVGRFKDFEVEIRGRCRVTSVQLASSTDELKGI